MFLVEKISDGILKTGHEITVKVHCDFNRSMSEALTDDFRLDASPDQHRRVSVAEIMERSFRHPGEILLFALGVNLSDQAEDWM